MTYFQSTLFSLPRRGTSGSRLETVPSLADTHIPNLLSVELVIDTPVFYSTQSNEPPASSIAKAS